MPLQLGEAWRKTTLPGDGVEQGTKSRKAGLGAGVWRRRMRSFLSAHIGSEEGALGALLACPEGRGSCRVLAPGALPARRKAGRCFPVGRGSYF